MNRLLPAIGRIAVTLVFVVLAVVAMVFAWRHYEDDPWTRDGIVQADSVEVSADVMGLVTDVRVHDNQCVRPGDVLFTVDRARYAAKLDEADATVQSARASIRMAIAKVGGARAALDNARLEELRYISLGELVSREDRDQKITDARQKESDYRQSQASVDEARASLKMAEANRRKAAVDVERSTVRASVEGLVTNLKLVPGDYISSGMPQFAVLAVDSFHVLGYLEETKLHRFNLGDRARVTLLGDDRPFHGIVTSIAGGIADQQKKPSADVLPSIMPTFSWVRLAQRVPVRVQIEDIPADLRLVAGRTATVTILPGTRAVRVGRGATTLPPSDPASSAASRASPRLDRPCGGVGT